MQIKYKASGDYLYPVVEMTDEETELVQKKHAWMRENYLREYDDAAYQALIVYGKLDNHLANIERDAETLMEQTVESLQKKYPALDRADMLAWVGHMNNLNAMAEEVVLQEIVYA